jgi:MFS family permease
MSVFASIMPNYAAAAILLSFGGLLNGYDTGSIGAIVHMAQFTTSMGALSPLARGMTVSAIMLTGVIPSFFAGQLADKYGRLRVIAPGALVFCVGAVFQAAATGLPQFIAGRAVAGFGQGVFLGNVTVYIAEVAPARRRGRLAALPQFMATLGICVGYFSCFGTAGIDGDLAWRLPYAVPVACSLMLALGCRLLPEPPRWLALSGRGDEAQDALRALNVDVDEARRDFLTAAQDRPSLSDWQSFVLLFRRGYRSQTWLALFMLSMVQLSGIDAITYVSHHPLQDEAILVLTHRNLVVRPGPLQPGWHLLRQDISCRFGRLLHHHAARLHSGLPARRPLGPPHRRHLGWRPALWPHVPHGQPVRRRRRAAPERRQLGRRRLRLPLRHGLLRHMGHHWQDLRERDLARQHACRCQSAGHGL